MVKRYDPIVVHHSGYIYPSVGMQKDPDGHYVLYSDYAKLEAERDALKEGNERMREALNRIASWREGPRVTSSFDEPGSAEIARQALKGGGNRDLPRRLLRNYAYAGR